MRKAAAIILIVAAVMNVLRGVMSAFVGGVATGSAPAASVDSGSQAFWAAFGVFLLALALAQIAGAVLLLLARGRLPVTIIAALSVAAELVMLFNTGMLFWQLFGLVGGILAFIGARGIGRGRP